MLLSHAMSAIAPDQRPCARHTVPTPIRNTMLVIWPLVWPHYLSWLVSAVAACLPYVRSRTAAVGLGVASAAILLCTPRFVGAIIAAMLMCWGLTGMLYIRGIFRGTSRLDDANVEYNLDTPRGINRRGCSGYVCPNGLR
jgi:hypothetical protein